MAKPVEDGFLPFSLEGLPSPTLRVGKRDEQAQISLENANFSLEPNRKVLFGGNGQISAVGDLNFLTTGIPTVPALTIFANGNIGVTTNLEVNGKASIGKDANQTNLTVIGTVSATKFEGDGSGLKNVGIASQWVGDKDNISFEGNVGIGTKAAEAKLQVAGNLKLQQGNPVNEFVSDLESVQGDGTASVPTVAALNKVVNKIKEEFKKVSDQSEAVKKELASVKQELTSTKQELTSVKQELTSTKQELTSVKQELTSTKQELTSTKQELTSVKQELASVKQELTSTKQELTSVKQELTSTKQELTSTKQEIQSLKQQNQNLRTNLQNTQNELNQLKNQENRVRPTSVIAINNNNEWIALKAGGYNVGDLESMGIGNDRLANLLVPPKWKVFCYKDANYQSNPIHTAGPYYDKEDGRTPTWGFVPDWLNKQISSIKIQAA